jgi:hypothetical protein
MARSAAFPGVWLLLSGCREAPDASGSRALTVAVRNDVSGIFPNPPIGNDSHTLDVNAYVFEGLMRLDRSLAPQPALAAHWESPDRSSFLRFAEKYGDSGKLANFFFSDHSLARARARNLERELSLNYRD